jgi:LacI family transcriptional regulator
MASRRGVSLAAVARHAGVSTTTASMVLGDRWREFRITPATRDRVAAAAAELGYTARRTTRTRGPLQQRLWVLFSPTDFGTGPTSEFYEGISAYSREEQLGFETVLFPFERGRLADKAEWLTSSFAAGAIMLGLGEEDVAFLEEQDLDIPLALANRVSKRWPSVVTDDYELGQLVFRHFVARGLTSMAMVVPEYSTRSQSLRMVGFADGYARFVRRRGAKGPATDVPQSRGTNDYAGGRAATAELLADLPPRTGIFVLNDNMVGGVLHTLQEGGRSIPADVELVSYGNSTLNAALRPAVTSVSVPLGQMSRDCARALHQATDLPAETGHLTRMLDVELILRESSPAPEA